MLEICKDNIDLFTTEVLEETEKAVFVDFWGDKCEICKQLMPGVHELAEKYSDKIKFASFNITGARRVAMAQKVLGLPTMIIYKNGERAAVLTPDKVSNIADVENFIKSYCETI